MESPRRRRWRAWRDCRRGKAGTTQGVQGEAREVVRVSVRAAPPQGARPLLLDGERPGLVDLRGMVLAAYLSVGSFKADPRLQWLPVDATLLLALAVAGLTCLDLLLSGFRIHRNAGWMLLLFAVFAIPVPWTEFHAYAFEKVSRFFTLTLIAAVAPFVLLRRPGAVHRFFNALCLISAVMGIDAALRLLQGSGDVTRLSAFGANPISFGREMGGVLLWCAALGVEGRLRADVAVAGVVAAGVLLVGSGSRGPLLAALGALAAAGPLFYWRSSRVMIRFGLAAAAVAVALSLALLVSPEDSGHRIERLARGALGASELTRLDAYARSLRLIADHPEGIGWGGFAHRIDQLGTAGADRQYPHNLILEAFLEGGWLAGLYLTLLLAGVGLRISSLRPTSEHHGVFLFYLFFLLNSMVSGDLNDNRHLFALMAIGLHAGWDDEQAQGGARHVGASGA